MTTPQLNLSLQPSHNRCLPRPCLLKLLEATGHLPHTMPTEPLLRQEDFTVGWICALPTEMAAACAMLDEEYDMLHNQHPADHNSYQLGRIGRHKIVIACLPEYGTSPAATVAKDMLRTFESIKVGVVVGIGAGIPSEHNEIRLGDVVVSSSEGTHGGVVQWDRGKIRDGVFERKQLSDLRLNDY